MFKNKTILITGASAGFGHAMAHTFAKEGANLILIARRKDRLDSIANQLQTDFGIKVYSMGLDIANGHQVEQSFKELPKEFERIDILINNAGMVKGLNKIWETPPEEYNEMIDINIRGLLNISYQVIPRMVKINSGHIINIGSIAGHESYPGGGVYSAAKHALRAITDTLRKELVATPIRVSMVSPGMAKTEFSLVRYHGDKDKAESIYKNFEPLLAEDIAEIVFFIANRPSHVNIADIIVFPTKQASTSLLSRDA